MRRVGHDVSYSTWNPQTLAWDYWRAMGATPLRAGVMAPRPNLAARRIGLSPEDAARTLPLSAVKIGSGDIARGLVARRGGLGALDLAPGAKLAVAAGAAYLLWRMTRKKGR